MQGTLLRYGPGAAQLAFISSAPPSSRPIRATAPSPPPAPSITAAPASATAPLDGPYVGQTAVGNRFLVLLGGLTDGLMFAPYIEPLAAATAHAGWTLVQGQLSSSYQGFGCCDLDGDADELHLLCTHLSALPLLTPSRAGESTSAGAHPTPAVAVAPALAVAAPAAAPPAGAPAAGLSGGSCIALMGHSTGCQIICRYLRRRACGQYKSDAQAIPLVKGIVLQAPVSDREWLGMYTDELRPIAESARALVAAGRGGDIVARLELVGGVPITASRFVALHDVGGDDDMFSSDLKDEELQAHLAPVGATCPCLVLASGADEAVPSNVDITHQAGRIAAAVGTGGAAARAVVVGGAPHNLAGYEAEGVAAVCAFLSGLQ